ncbi:MULTISPECIES: TIGR03915 family putative DNA repair protein [Sphingobacterium]|uniref:TIGR03915 family putative DNA repair protein n=1 Tax=Sphingobacterium TaxID=28453 RepID=UPI0013D9364C|nr:MULTISPECIES: TIGR03915 family putative DNA repair protein [unclassified Sphingobacterium]
MIYRYDGSYEGLLTAIFTVFECREFDVQLQVEYDFQESLFETAKKIPSDAVKARRVNDGLTKLLTKNGAIDFWRAFLAEDSKIHQIIFELIIAVFKTNSPTLLDNYGDERVLLFRQTLLKVSRERHRMKAFVRFHKDSNGMYVAIIEPDFNVLPLIISFFRDRYADQHWLIYDNKRCYGIYYDLYSVTEVTLSVEQSTALQKSTGTITLDADDNCYTVLWQSYFQSTNIEARKNLKLHLRHVPKRYWKYLPEKTNKS